jgi:predicted RND superfamily exporter protein
MASPPHGRLAPVFRFIVAKRWWIAALYALLLPFAIRSALSVQQDDAIERLIVESDPEWKTARAFEEVFGGGEFVLVLAEFEPPFTRATLRRVDEIERALAGIERSEASSILSVYRRARGALDTDAAFDEFARFVAGTDLFRRQGLVGERFFGIAIGLDVATAAARNAALQRIDAGLAPFERAPAPLVAVRKVGGPYVDRFLERETANAVRRYMPLFGLFLVAINLFLYRSWRALAAFCIATGASVALTVGLIGSVGGVLTIVSSLIPMTVLITCTATLVYIHSRFVEQPAERTFEEQQVFALENKFLPCTASILAAIAGFASLAISRIQPIRDLGLWTAGGLALTWVVAFTLFPALQRILRTPTRAGRRVAASGAIERLADFLPGFTYRARFVLVPGALLLCALGAGALFGIPGVIEPMRLETGGIEYIDPGSDVYRDTRRFEQLVGGLTVTEVWLRGEAGHVTDPESIGAMERFVRKLEADARVGAVIGPTTILRMQRYVGGAGDVLPDDAASLEALAGNLEQLALSEPAIRAFIDTDTLAQARMTVRTHEGAFPELRELERLVEETWEGVRAGVPALARTSVAITGHGPLQAKMAANLVPTLTESFAITAAIIFVTFLVVFRSGAARVMAMIPSLFAILVMFGVMRVFGIGLNVATILIATTVLGASENDQIHFFHHYLEGGRGSGTEAGLRHAFRVAGGAILFATLINAGGFLALALSDLPPMRHFGAMSALAFMLSMIADFTALPAALWLVFRDAPKAARAGATENVA